MNNFKLLIIFWVLFLPKFLNAATYNEANQSTETRVDSLIAHANDIRISNPTESREFLQKALDLLAIKHNAKDESEVLKLYGLTYYYEANYSEALAYYQKALSISRKIGDSVQVANILHNKGMIYRDTHQWEIALKYAYQVLKLDEYAKNDKGLGYSYNNLGLIYEELKDTLNAKSSYEKSLAIREAIGHQEGIGYTLINLGNIAIAENDYEKAELYFERAAKIYDQLNDPYKYSRALYCLGNIGWYQKQYAQAKKYYRESLNIRLKENVPLKDLADSYVALGMIAEHEGRLSEADSLYIVSLNYSKAINDLAAISDINKRLYTNAEKQKNYKGAITYLENHYQLREKIFNNQRLEKYNQLRSTYELDQKQKELQAIKRDNQLTEENSKLNSLITVAIILLLLTIILFGVFFYKLKSKHMRQLNIKNSELQMINESLDQFVSIASHDLKAPIASSKGIITIIKDQNDITTIKELLDLQEQSLSKLEILIKDLLDFSRSSRQETQVEKVDLQDKIETIKNNLRFEKRARKVDISLIENADIDFYSDVLRVRIILNNLISNAIQYKNPAVNNPYVKIEAFVTRQKTLLKVSDNGLGISEEHHSKIFNMFYKANKSPNSTGLGLYIVKESLDKLNGKIWFESEEGKGTIFYVELPNLINQNDASIVKAKELEVY